MDPARGQTGGGNIRLQSRQQRRYRCLTCGRTFAATRGTPCYRLKMATELVTLGLRLLCHGCPPPASVAAFGLDRADRRRVAGPSRPAGPTPPCPPGAAGAGGPPAPPGRRAGGQDGRWPPREGPGDGRPLAAGAGGVIRPRRDLALITSLVRMVRSAASRPAILVCVEGQASSGTAFTRVFRDPARPGRLGRRRWVPPAGVRLGQVLQPHAGRRVVGITRRVVPGTAAALTAVLLASGRGTGLTTAYVERFKATFRGALSTLTRRGRVLAHGGETLTAGMELVGWANNLGWDHASLGQGGDGGAGLKWRPRPPALGAGRRDPRWRKRELLSPSIPPPPWVAPQRRGRPPRRERAVMPVAA